MFVPPNYASSTRISCGNFECESYELTFHTLVDFKPAVTVYDWNNMRGFMCFMNDGVRKKRVPNLHITVY